MTIALDGSATAGAGSGGPNTSGSVTLTTTHANDIIVLAIGMQFAGSTLPSVSSVSGASLSWSKRPTGVSRLYVDGSNHYGAIEVWEAKAASALSSQTITVNFNESVGWAIVGFGVSGADQTTPFDPNAGIPGTATNGTPAASVTANITTTHPDDFLLMIRQDQGSQGGTLPSGFTQIGYMGSNHDSSFVNTATWVAYKVVSATQSAAAITITGGTFTDWCYLVDALTADPTVTSSAQDNAVTIING